jgi:Tripartite tricarboxylate transporter TctB family
MNDRNLLKGMFLVAVALTFGLGSLRYDVGHVARAGPGFFPLMVSSILGFLGLSMIVRSRFMDKVPMYFNLKNLAIIMVSLAGFSLLSHVTMIAGITFLVFFSTLAGRTYSLKRNTMIAAVLIAIAFVFQKGLGLQLPLY